MLTSHRLLLQSASFVRILAILFALFLGTNLSIAQSDVSLSKSASISTASVGDQVSFTLTVVNEGSTTLTNVVVNDPIPANATFVSSSGAGSYVAGTGNWTFPSIAPGTNAVSTLTVMTTDEGIIYSLAEVTAMDQVDDDSTPGNTDYNEDDIASSCTSIPVEICPAS